MGAVGPRVVTARLVLRPFTDVDRAPFAALNAHPLVVESLGSSPIRAESDAMVDHYRRGDGPRRLGAVGGRGGRRPTVRRHGGPAPGARGAAVRPGGRGGWRLHPDHWGHGYATEAAAASLDYGFDEAGLDEIVAFTTTVNTRSQAVMERIGMGRDPEGDFDHPRLPEGSPLRRHVLYRVSRGTARP